MKQLTAKQFIILAFLVIIAQKMFMLPSIIMRVGGRDGYLAIATFIAIEIAILAMIMLSAKWSKNRTIYTILSKSTTKIGAKILTIFLIVYLFAKMMLLFCELRVFFNNSLSDPLNEWLALIPLMFLLFLVGTKTLRGIGRLGEILVFFIVLAYVLLILLVATNLNFLYILPFAQNGFGVISKSVINFPMWFGDLSILIIAIGNIQFSPKSAQKLSDSTQKAPNPTKKSTDSTQKAPNPTKKSTDSTQKEPNPTQKAPPTDRHFVKIGLIVALIGGLMALFFATALFASYGDMSDLIDYSHNISNMLLYSSSSYIYGRFDVPIFCIWIFSVFVQLSLVFYSITRHISFVFDYKNNKIVSFLVATSAYFVFGFCFKSDYTLINFSTSWIRIFALIHTIFAPILLLICTIIISKKDKSTLKLNKIPLSTTPKFHNIHSKISQPTTPKFHNIHPKISQPTTPNLHNIHPKFTNQNPQILQNNPQRGQQK